MKVIVVIEVFLLSRCLYLSALVFCVSVHIDKRYFEEVLDCNESILRLLFCAIVNLFEA